MTSSVIVQTEPDQQAGSWQHEPERVSISHLAPERVSISHLAPELCLLLRQRLSEADLLPTLLRIYVVQEQGRELEDLPPVAGSYELAADRLSFFPFMPFDRGVTYRAVFAPQAVDRTFRADSLVSVFSLPQEILPVDATAVEAVYPSADRLPENILRFFVRFSQPMQRGRAQQAIVLLGPDESPIEDALYRAPVELWDRSLQTLTVLLDPGRLKRHVGPNVALGPPLQARQQYTLRIGQEMLDSYGRPLRAAFHKHFRVEDPVRSPVSPGGWQVKSPPAHSRDALTIHFPRPLDWASVQRCIRVRSEDGNDIAGEVTVGKQERLWSFTPESPWLPGSYRLVISPHLEDVCGNSVLAAFDRPVPARHAPADETISRVILFRVG